VWALLQPRDYINSLQLLSALGLIVVGLIVAACMGGAPIAGGAERVPLEIVAPMVQWSPKDAPMIFPFLFITIACGAISGFHCLVSSGTSSKQLDHEPAAQFVGYGSMLTEGFLATLVILACVAGLGLGVHSEQGPALMGQEAWLSRYASWTSAESLGAKVGAFVDGSANFLKAIGIPAGTAVALMGVLVASFAGTTLDTACRLQRYVIQELARTRLKPASTSRSVGHLAANKYVATLLAVTIAGIIAALPLAGQSWTWQTAGGGGLILWPMFGATNQLLGGLAFLVIGFYLWRRNKPVWFLVLPMLFMLIMPAWAMLIELPRWWQAENPNFVLIGIGIATLVLELWMLIEAALLWPKVKGQLETSATE